MSKKKDILCPRCKRRVAAYDGKSTIDVVARCVKCRKRIIYRVDTGNIEMKPLPQRKCSSGCTFS